MVNQILFFSSSFFLTAWGVAHLFPTKSVVRGFGELSADNRRIITMEWIIEGVFLIFIGSLIAATTLVDHAAPVSRVVQWLSFAALNVLAVVSMFTGFRISFLPFKLCPFIFWSSAALIVLGVYL